MSQKLCALGILAQYVNRAPSVIEIDFEFLCAFRSNVARLAHKFVVGRCDLISDPLMIVEGSAFSHSDLISITRYNPINAALPIRLTKIQRFALALTLLNLALLVFLVVQHREASAKNVAPALRGRELQIVDDQGRVRADLKIYPASPKARMPVIDA
jgi:hypothetical protein